MACLGCVKLRLVGSSNKAQLFQPVYNYINNRNSRTFSDDSNKRQREDKGRISYRNFATQLAVNKSKKHLSITDIPTPKGIPILGTTFSQILAGSSPQLHWYIDRRHKELGPMFREKIGPVDCVFLSDPDGMRSVFAQEGKYPLHIQPPAWITYNRIHGVSRGLFFMNGEEWLHFRRIMNNCLLKGNTNWMEPGCRSATKNLLTTIGESAENGEIFKNLEENLYKWALDVIVSILIGPEMFWKNQNILKHHIQELASTVHLIFETSSKLQLISPEFAAALKIPRWNKFETAVSQALKSTKDLLKLISDETYNDPNGLLAKLRTHMTEEDLFKIVADLILAAGDTTAYTLEWILYLMGKHGKIQEKLRNELIESHLKGENPLSNVLLKNIVRETLRLYPVAPFLNRILPHPSRIMDYDCPAKTVVILSIFSTGRDEKYFERPLEFDPDRWNRKEGRNSIIQNSNLPFALGARSCIGKKLAETQIQMALAAIVENYKFTTVTTEEVKVIMKMVAVPSCPIDIKFVRL